ncbi:hypothetical protein ACHAXR_009013 [Thalassiosira sp. AJA248-18]
MDQSYEHIRPHRYSHGYDDDDNENITNDNMAAMQESPFLDNIIVGYAFGKKKMETMGLIMAEASKAMSTFECSGTLASLINKKKPNNLPIPQRQQQQRQQNINEPMELFEEASMATMTTGAASMLTSQGAGESSDDVEKESVRTHYFSDNEEEDSRSLSSTYTRSSFISQRSQKGPGGSNGINGIQLTFLPDSSGSIHLVRTGEGESVTGSSITTSATTLASCRKQGGSAASWASSSMSKEIMNESPNPGLASTGKQKYSQFSSRRSNGSGCSGNVQQHSIRVSFVPIDLDTPLEEQHGGKFDVILHKMTEDILSMSKMLRARGQSSGDLEEGGDMLRAGEENTTSESLITSQPVEDPHLFEATPFMTRHQARASQRILRLREYKQTVHPSCVLVDSPNNILAVMSRADMAEVLSRCLAGVTTKGGIPVRTPRFRVVDEDTNVETLNGSQSEPIRQRPTLADEIDNSGFEYPLIAKPLTAAGTKSSHHMGIVLARDGLQRLKTPCLLQEYANHGEKLFKVYVLGESVWVFSRESLPNLPLGEKTLNDTSGRCPMEGEPCVAGDIRLFPHKRPRTESYVEFERPAGSRYYVEFNSQRPYPKLSDFGITSGADDESSCRRQDDSIREHSGSPVSKKQRLDFLNLDSCHDEEHQQSTPPAKLNNQNISHGSSDLARFVSTDEIEPVTRALREAFGLELFGFDVLVKHNQNSPIRSNEKEILVVDVNYFPGYKEVPHFPSLLAQYLTQKAVESRLRNFDGS